MDDEHFVVAFADVEHGMLREAFAGERGGCGTSVLPGLSAALNCTSFTASKPMGFMCSMSLSHPELVNRAQSKAALSNRTALARAKYTSVARLPSLASMR